MMKMMMMMMQMMMIKAIAVAAGSLAAGSLVSQGCPGKTLRQGCPVAFWLPRMRTDGVMAAIEVLHNE